MICILRKSVFRNRSYHGNDLDFDEHSFQKEFLPWERSRFKVSEIGLTMRMLQILRIRGIEVSEKGPTMGMIRILRKRVFRKRSYHGKNSEKRK